MARMASWVGWASRRWPTRCSQGTVARGGVVGVRLGEFKGSGWHIDLSLKCMEDEPSMVFHPYKGAACFYF